MLEAQAVSAPPSGLDKRIIVAAIAVAVLAVVGGGGGYYYKKSRTGAGDVPEATAVTAMSAVASSPVVTAVADSRASSTIVPAAMAASAPATATAGGIAPTDADISAQRKDGDARLAQGDASGAEFASNRAAAKEMVKVAIAEMSQGKLDDAEKELNNAGTRDPKQPLVYYNLAVLRLKQGRTDEALKEFEASFLNGFTYFDEMTKDPDLDGIRNDPRFVALVNKYRSATT
ncbi:tetratricopeptide repeat protein [Paraburkholderia sp.]|uniref:tetratricopeptide repeat protein n=1 Tax=Paraburkholderia sp. TaxID=1926495 RepID=UPI002F41FE58